MRSEPHSWTGTPTSVRSNSHDPLALGGCCSNAHPLTAIASFGKIDKINRSADTS